VLTDIVGDDGSPNSLGDKGYRLRFLLLSFSLLRRPNFTPLEAKLIYGMQMASSEIWFEFFY
jgi:hypothetical protein